MTAEVVQLPRPAKPAKTLHRLTDALAKKLPAPGTGNKVYFDDSAPGFGVRVTARDSRSYILDYTTKAGRHRMLTIGAIGDWRCAAARGEARTQKRIIDQGGDPQGDLQALREAPTVGELCDRFVTEHVSRKRPSTAEDYKRILALHVRPALGALKVESVTFADCDSLHRRLTAAGTTYMANRTIAVLSKMFNLAARWGMRPDNTNPCRGIERNQETKRKRYLVGNELARPVAALAAYPDKQTADIVRLLLFTGCRKGEALSARWADLDLQAGVWSKPGATTKQKTDHVAPLSPGAVKLLSEIRAAQIMASRERVVREFVFAGPDGTGHRQEFKNGWTAICKAAGITGMRVHDLRHTFASLLVSEGASLPLIGALLGHSNPVTTARYAHLLQDPLRAAATKVGDIISAAGKTRQAQYHKLSEE
jgi:integrase